MFEGLELAEMHVAQAGRDHPVRRIVMISDGQANVGPSSPLALGELAQRSLSLGAQVTSLGVGLDYDERTLDAIAERTSGRLFHVGDPREMDGDARAARSICSRHRRRPGRRSRSCRRRAS